MEVQNIDLRFNDRVLAFHAYINTERDPHPIAMEIQRVASGVRRDALACWTERFDDGEACWAKMVLEHKLKNPPTLSDRCKRVLVFHTLVNTDADPYHIHKRILQIARGPLLDATVCWAEVYEGENGRTAWAAVQKVAKQVLADPRSKSFTR